MENEKAVEHDTSLTSSGGAWTDNTEGLKKYSMAIITGSSNIYNVLLGSSIVYCLFSPA